MRILLAPLLGIASLSCSALAFHHALAQNDPSPKGPSFSIPRSVGLGWLFAWDESRNELITDSEEHPAKNRSVPVIAVYNVDSGVSRFIHISQQFPDAPSIYLDALASAPQGSVLLACQIVPGSRPYVGEHLLLYDDHSAPIRDFIAADYSVDAVTADASGNVFLLGTHDSERSTQESYSLIQQYDSYGHVVAEMLPRSLFPNEDSPTDDGHQRAGYSTGTPLLSVSHNGLRAYLPKIGDMFALGADGEIQARVNIVAKLSDFARSQGYTTFTVDSNAFSPSGDLWLIGRMERTPSHREDSAFHHFLVRITSEGNLDVPYEHVLTEEPTYLPQLIGFTSSGEPVVWGAAPGGSIISKSPF